MNESDILKVFCDITSCREAVGTFFLMDSEWSLQIAIEKYYACSGNMTGLDSWNDRGDEQIQSNDSQDVYTEGIQFWYWTRNHLMPSTAIPVKRVFYDLKEEMVNKIGARNWKYLWGKCEKLMETALVRKISANGVGEDIYVIGAGAPFEIQYLMALKLYTDFDDLNHKFCEHFRLQNVKGNTLESPQSLAIRNGRYWNMAKLLTECVQCFGQLLIGKKKRYFRGINKAFIIPRFVARFHAPLSTSKSVC